MPRTVAIGYNTCHYAFMMRANLMKAIKRNGYNVVVLAPKDRYTVKLNDLGIDVIDIPMKMNKNPITDLQLMLRFRKELKRINPSIYLGYTAKPNIFGALAASHLGIPTINNISGLGSQFISNGIITLIMKWLYSQSLGKSSLVFFQNPDDATMFKRDAIVTHSRTEILPGSGVDLRHFSVARAAPRTGRKFRFLLVARLLREKGIYEFIEAARGVLNIRNDVEFRLMGSLSGDNPSAVDSISLQKWLAEGTITYVQFCDDVRPELLACDCVVLPSYREGTPRVLLEAAACGRPLITTNVPGCRETVINEKSGYLCTVRSSQDLIEKMMTMLNLTDEQLDAMGRAGRAYMELRYDEDVVIARYINAINQFSIATHHIS